MKRLLTILLLPVLCFAQKPFLFFEKLTVENGLSHNKVNCIIQDSRGFVWLGTDDGLNRYDGRSFTQFKSVPGDTTTLSGNIVTDILEDKNGRLWIATADGGISRYDYRLPPAQQFRCYNQLSGAATNPGPVNAVNTLLEDTAGYLWLGTSGRSVLRFEKQTGRIKDITSTGKTVLDLCQDKHGTIWVGRQGGGILKIDPRTLRYSEDARYSDLYAQLPHVTVTALYKDTEGTMWFGSWDKVLYRYDPASGSETGYTAGSSNSFQNDEVRCFAEDGKGWLWLGGKEKGLQLYDKSTGRFYQYTYNAANNGSISDNRINTIFVDGAGLVWIGTNQGVSVTNPQKQYFSQHFLKDERKTPITVYDFFEAADSSVWIGTSEGIFIRDREGSLRQQKLYYKNRLLHITSFYRHEGSLYLGTDYSLFRYNPAGNTVSLLPNTEKDGVMNRIIESRVVSMVHTIIDQRPVMLVSPYGHFLAYYDQERKKWISRLDSSQIIRRFNLADNLIRKFHKLDDGTILLATAKAGLGIWPAGAEKVSYLVNDPFKPESITNNHVSDICDGKGGMLWVSTYGGGLHVFNRKTKTFAHIRESNNLLEGIATDRHGNVWMTSNGHLQKYDGLHRTYTSYQLPDAEKTGGIRGKLFTDSRGWMYVAGTSYFITFHPDSVQVSAAEPRVVFTNFHIFNQAFSHLLQQDRITVKHNENYFTFEFAAPYYSPEKSVRYSYRLEGFDKDWVEAGERNFVSYSNLSGGEYTFRVRATGTPGTWSPHTASIRLTVVPPYWQRLWFYLLCAFVLAGAGYLISRYRINQLLKQQAIRNRIAQDLHDNVGSTLSSISVYSQVAKIYQQKEKEGELRTTLEKISATSTEMISELNDTVWAINPRNDNMEVILQRMESFARPLLAAQGVRFHFYHDASLPLENLEMEKRKSFYAIFKEAVNNAVKYAGCKNITVNVLYKAHKVIMTITDDGRGFDLSKTSEGYKSSDVFGGGNGLRNMQQRAVAMRGQLKMKSEPGAGTTVELEFPIP